MWTERVNVLLRVKPGIDPCRLEGQMLENHFKGTGWIPVSFKKVNNVQAIRASFSGVHGYVVDIKPDLCIYDPMTRKRRSRGCGLCCSIIDIEQSLCESCKEATGEARV